MIEKTPDKIIKESIKQIKDSQISLKSRKAEFEQRRKEDKERGRERSIIMLGFEKYQMYRASKELEEASKKYRKALKKKGKERTELVIEGTEILDGIGFNWDLPKDMLRHIAMIEYMAFRAGFFQAASKFDTWLKNISEEKLIEAHKKAKKEKFEDIKL